jgi:hypothetical protein
MLSKVADDAMGREEELQRLIIGMADGCAAFPAHVRRQRKANARKDNRRLR